jgi:GNAT superfamily N-acetyltransferase
MMMTGNRLWTLRPADASDLGGVNAVIESAIGTWGLPARVKRLCLPVYRYSTHDLDFLDLVVAVAADIGIVGVAAWERADPGDAPVGRNGLLLHGIYVAPDQQRKGIGTHLFRAAETAALARGLDGVLVKAQPGAADFFVDLGLERLPVEDHRRDYPHRFWMPLVRVRDGAA